MNKKRIIYTTLGVFIVLGIGVLLFKKTDYGSIAITISESGSIYIVGNDQTITKENTKTQYVKLVPGDYNIEAVNQKGSKSRATTTIKRSTKSELALSFADQQTLLQASGENLRFVYKIGPDAALAINDDVNAPQVITPQKTTTLSYPSSLEIKDEDGPPTTTMLSPLEGGLFLQETTRGAFIIDTNTQTIKNLPINNKNIEQATAAASSDAKKLLVLDAGTLYVFNPPYSEPQKRVVVDDVPKKMSAGPNYVVFYSPAEEVNDDPKSERPRTSAVLMNLNTEDRKNINAVIESPIWSPLKNMLAYISGEDKSMVLYSPNENTEKLTKISPDQANIYWFGEDIWYGKDGGYWSLSTPENYSKLLFEAKNLPETLTYNNFGTYLTSSDGYQGNLVWRLTKSPNKTEKIMANKLPVDKGDYRLSSSGLFGSVIMVELNIPRNGTDPGRAALYNQRVLDAKSAAQNDINELGLEAGTYRVVYR